MKQKQYFPQLDSLRFFAFLSVFISHLAIFYGFDSTSAVYARFKEVFLTNGDLGVNFFFVLSGFLITTLLMREQDEKKDISVGKFYMRRILRIWPIYYLTVFVGFFIVPHVLMSLGNINLVSLIDSHVTIISRLPWYIFFFANIDMSYMVIPNVVLLVLWSISVEEQFYLFWPWVVKMAHRSFLPLICIVIILLSTFFRYIMASDEMVFDYFTISVASSLAVGALLAWAILQENFISYIKNLSRRKIGLIYVALLALLLIHGEVGVWFHDRTYATIHALVPLVGSLLFALVIAEQEFSDRSWWKVGNWKLADTLGKRSYGLYCYHMIAAVIVLTAAFLVGLPMQHSSVLLWLTEGTLAFIVTLILGFTSYRYIETPFLRLKKYFAR